MIYLYRVRERLMGIFTKFDFLFIPLVKFLTAFFAYLWLNANVGFMEKISKPVIALLAALLAAILPWGGITAIGTVLLLMHMFALSLEAFIVTLVLVLIAGILYYLFAPGSSVVIALTPLAFYLKLPYALPVMTGLLSGVTSAVSLVIGVFFYYWITYIRQIVGIFTDTSLTGMLQRFVQMINGFTGNRMLILMSITLAVSLVLVAVIRKLPIPRARVIAIAAGFLTNLLILFIIGYSGELSVSVSEVLLGTLGSAVLVTILEFMIFCVDYGRTEYLEFEDDHYVYQVKALPKIEVLSKQASEEEKPAPMPISDLDPDAMVAEVGMEPEPEEQEDHKE